jgi:hypothetical protein
MRRGVRILCYLPFLADYKELFDPGNFHLDEC